jgi:hypothetical protein
MRDLNDPTPNDAIPTEFVEKRSKPRVQCSYPATLRGRMADGMRFEARAVLANMSAGGFYLHTRRPMKEGETLLVIVRLSTSPLGDKALPRLAAAGRVVRVEHKPDGTCGVALMLHQHRFL